MTLGHKVFLLVCMAVAPVAMVQFHNVTALTATFDDAAANIARSSLGTFRESYASLVRDVSDASLAARGSDPCSAAEEVVSRTPQAPLVGFVGFRPDGAVACSTRQADDALVAARPLALRAAETGHATASTWSSAERRGVALATSPQGRPDRLVMVAILDERWMGRSGAATTLASASLVLAGANGEILAAHPGNGLRHLDPKVLAESGGGTRFGTLNARWEDGRQRLAAFGTAPVPGLPFPAVVLDREFVVEARDRAYGSTLFALGAGLLAALAAAWLGTRRFVASPVSALLSASRRLQAGERGVRVGRVRGEEMSSLAAAFDSLSEAIEVAERTRDERERAARSESEARRIFEAVMETSPDAVFVKDTKGFVTAANPGVAAVHGLPRDQLIGMHESELAPSREAGELAGHMRREALATGRPVTFETTQRYGGTSGERVYELIYAPMRDGEGKIVALSCVGRDVTERKRAEAALASAMERIADVSRSKTEFLAATSHDLRQPAQAAMLFAETLARDLRDTREGRILGDLRRALSSLNGMLDSLLDTARLDAGAVVAEPRDVHLGQILSELRAGLRPKAELKGVALRVEVYDAHVTSDPVLLARMLRNLMENALRYTEQGQVSVACEPRGQSLDIVVSDTGVGIEPDDLFRIWNEFSQVKAGGGDPERGLGIGLAVVRRLSGILDHPVQVRSTPGVGSTFTVTVPLAATPRPATAPRPAVAASGATAAGGADEGATVVVVEDDAMIRSALAMLLTSRGHTVLQASDVEGAVRVVEEGGAVPGAVLADYKLRGDRRGSEAIRLIRERVGSPVPAILLTGDVRPEVTEAAREFGARMLHKPVPPGQLFEALDEILPRA